MPETRIDSAVGSTDQHTDFAVSAMTTDAAGDQKETIYDIADWDKYLGYYKKIPELRAVIDARATWTVGKGFEADPETTIVFENIHGWGKETFNTILENMIRTYTIVGDSFAEIIYDPFGNLINLKPLDPSSMRIVIDRQGLIKRYEQKAKNKTPNKKFDTLDIFHLTRNRVADEIHGVSVIEALEPKILMLNQALDDWKRVLHRNIDPMMIYHLDTDDPTEIAAFKKKVDAARGAGENIYIPKDAVVPEAVALAPNASLNPLPWIDSLKNQFFQAVGVPQIILGGSAEFTEATAKIAYLAFQQSVEEEQLFIEEQVWEQLFYKINLEFPASLENEMLSDQKKDATSGAAQPNDTTAGVGS